MNTYTSILIEQSGTIGTIVLNRPERYNSLNELLCVEFVKAIKELDNNKTIKVIRIKGAGKGFCAGLDLFSVEEDTLSKAGLIVRDLFNPMALAIRNSPKPVVAQVSGAAAGAGCSLALACDAVYAADDAVFSLPFLNIELIPDTGASYLLVKQLGYKKAFDIFSGNTNLSASDAERCGLINKACTPITLEEKCMEHCNTLSRLNSQRINSLKQLLQAAETSSFSEILEQEASHQALAASDPAFMEAVHAFKKKSSK